MNRPPIRLPVSSRSAVVTVAIGVAFIALTSSLALSDTPLPQGIPQSCGIQLKGHNFTVQTLDKVHALGFRIVRRGLYWDSIEIEKGIYDFSKVDEPMRHGGKLGLTVVAVLFGSNRLYEDPSHGGIQSEAGRTGFANFAAAAAGHYKDQRVLWEIWNEPNVRTFWRKSGTHNSEEFAAEYTALVQVVAPAMLKADPNCFVLAGSVSNYWEPSYAWTEYCFKKGVLTSGIRGWSVHPYGVSTPEEFAVGHARMRALLKKYNSPQIPLLDTERGFSVKQSVEGWSGGAGERAREFQAWNLVRQYLIDQLCGVPVTVWYEWDGDEFGLAGEGGDRPALKAFEVTAVQLGGYRFARRLESDSPRDYLLLFENEAGKRKLAAWTAPPPGGSPDEARQHDVTVETDRSFAVTGLNGESQSLLGGIPLTLSGAPQYVELPADVKLVGSRTLQVVATPAPASVAGTESTKPPSAKLPVPAGVAVTGPSPDKLLTAGEWKFVKNTGDGSFELAKDDDGEPIGVLSYDFTKSKSKSTPYVLAVAAVNIPESRQLQLAVRSPIAQPLTFRVTDATGQTHQFKTRIQGSGKWEMIRIPLAVRFEHWDGANDGKIHFPVTSLTFSAPSPGVTKQGKVEYSRIAAGRGEE